MSESPIIIRLRPKRREYGFVAQQGAAAIRKSLLLIALLSFGVAVPAEATDINFPPISLINFFLPENIVAVAGTSTDGANFAASLTDSHPVKPLAGDARGKAGSHSAAQASAGKSKVTTGASAQAGPGQIATAIAIAKSDTSFSVAARVNGILVLKIDPPFLMGLGSAQPDMDFTATLNGSPIFSAGAMLDDGSLTTSGAFSDEDFSMQKSGSKTMALLSNDTFSIPFVIPASEVGQTMTFEFDQTFTATAQNGGTAMVENTPEPSSLWMLCAGAIALLLFRRICSGTAQRNHPSYQD